MPYTPSAAMAMNQSTAIGPNNLPTTDAVSLQREQ
jgi:hypothetical protein